MPKRILSGKVIASKSNKTVVVEVTRRVKHKLYKKIIKRAKKYHAHDEKNILKIVEKAGYKAAFTSNFGSFENSKSNFEINRTDIWSLDRHHQFIKKCLGNWDILLENK